MTDNPNNRSSSSVQSHPINVTTNVTYLVVGDFLMGAFVSCRGCGSAVSAFHQPSLRAHAETCAPLRSIR